MVMSTKIDYDEITEASPIRRFAATTIDIFLVFLLRVVTAQILMASYLSARLQSLSQDYINFYGSEIIDSPEKAQFIITHAVFSDIIIFVIILLLVGSLYYALLNSSKFHATIGKRLMRVEVLNSDYSKISFFKAFALYFLVLSPVLFMTYIFYYTVENQIGLIHAMFDNIFNILITVIIVLLSGTYSAGFRKQPGFDIVAKVVLLNNRSADKLPWEK